MITMPPPPICPLCGSNACELSAFEFVQRHMRKETKAIYDLLEQAQASLITHERGWFKSFQKGAAG